MKISVGLGQITGAPGDPEANLKLSIEASREAFEAGANLVVLPELLLSGYISDRAQLADIAEPIDGPAVTAWTELAAEFGGFISVGFGERSGEKIFNSTVIVGPEGPELHYRKIHLFDDEKLGFDPGDLGLPVADLPFGRVGMCVCYDLRFVEVVRGLALQGADLICVPTAWLAGFDKQKWDDKGLAPQANTAIIQANLSQVFIACASQVGPSGGRDFLGSSILVGPHGDLRMGPLSGTETSVEIAEIDLEDAVRARTRGERITPREDRRTDVYGLRIGSDIY